MGYKLVTTEGKFLANHKDRESALLDGYRRRVLYGILFKITKTR